MKALLLAGALLFAAPQASVTGRWLWQGQAGWQRITLDLKADGTRLRGVLRMGPGGSEPATPADFWEYFFDPADFEIVNGRINGSVISFEQEVRESSTRFLYTGTVEGDRIAFTREVIQPQTEKKTTGLGAHNVQFTAHRVP